MTTIIIHDVDRDGLGSAAMICAELGPENVLLVPTKVKDVRPLLAHHEAPRSVMVLDIPAPPSWDGISTDVAITWVDHHLAAWHCARPPNVKTILPTTCTPTTTMSLLVKHGIVTIPNVHRVITRAPTIFFLITTQAKRNLSSRSGIGGVRSAT